MNFAACSLANSSFLMAMFSNTASMTRSAGAGKGCPVCQCRTVRSPRGWIGSVAVSARATAMPSISGMA